MADVGVGTSYATIDDLEDRLDTVVDDEDRCKRQLVDASEYIDYELSLMCIDPSTVSAWAKKTVCVNMVTSWYATKDMPGGVSSYSESVGDVSSSTSYSSAVPAAWTGFRLSSQDRHLLGIGPSFGSFRMSRE